MMCYSSLNVHLSAAAPSTVAARANVETRTMKMCSLVYQTEGLLV